jgi:hypothetical protein
MNTPREIRTPRGEIVVTPGGRAELRWNAAFKPKWGRKYTKVQRYVDSEVLRLCEPYTPLLTGMLIMSSILGTFIGSGKVRWIAPYARPQYYAKRKPGSVTGPLRGPQWFERMKANHGQGILAGARAIYREST